MRKAFFTIPYTVVQMTKLNRLPLLLVFLFMMSSLGVRAQKETWDGAKEGELETVEIEIVNEREITLPKASRNFEKIPPRPAEAIKPPITYDFRAFSFQTPTINAPIRPLKVKQEGQSSIYNNYVSVGYGNYANPYLEAFVSSGRNKNKLLGAHAIYNNAIKGPVDGRNSGSGMYGLSIYGQSFSEVLSFTGNAGFENRSTHFYGYVPGTDVEHSEIRQSIGLFKLGLSLANARNSDFSYKLGGKFSYLGDKYDARESEIGFDLNSYYKIDDDQRIRLNADYALISRKDALVDVTPRNLFRVNAAYEFMAVEDLKVDAGVIVAYEDDQIDKKNVHVYPDVKVTYKLSPTVDAVGSLTGGIEKVSLQTLTNENLWLVSNIVDIFHTNKQFDFQVGVNAKLGNKVSASAGWSLASLKNWYSFVNDANDQSKFTVDYNPGATQRTNFFATVNYTQQYAKFMLRGDLYGYSQKDQVFHRPTYRVTTNASYTLYEKMIFKLDLIAQGGMKAVLDPASATPTIVTVDPAFDLNLRAEYLFSESLSFFLQFNNITSNKYPVFLNYPVRGFQVLGGVTWSF
jgi:hypothetical protein